MQRYGKNVYNVYRYYPEELLNVFYLLFVLIVSSFFSNTGNYITCYCNNKNSFGDSHRHCKKNRCVSNDWMALCYTLKIDNNGTIEKGCLYATDVVTYRKLKGFYGIVDPVIMSCVEPMCNLHTDGRNLTYMDCKLIECAFSIVHLALCD